MAKKSNEIYGKIEKEKAMNQANKKEEAIGYINLSPTYLAANKPQQAIDCLHKALAIAEELGDKHLEAVCCCNLGNAYTLPGKYQDALTFLDRALKIPGATIEMMKVQACSHCYLGEIYVNLKNYEEARKHGEQALSIAQKMGSDEDLAKAYVVLADISRVVGDKDKSILYYKKALEPISRTGAAYLEHSCCFRLGELVISKIASGSNVNIFEKQEAQEHFERAIVIARKIGSDQAVAEDQSYYGRFCLLTGEYKEAVKYYQAAESTFKKAGRKADLKILYGQMSIAYERMGQSSQAKKYKIESSK